MQNVRSTRKKLSTFLILAAVVLLNGCLMKENEPEFGDDIESDVEIVGSIGDGPVVSASIAVYRNDSVLLSEFTGDDSATYNITIKTKGKYYPLKIEARDGIDIVTNMAPDFTLIGAALEPGKRAVANINPFSTFAYELALELPGGINKANLGLAETTVTNSMNCGLSTLLSSGPMSTEIDETNVAEIVRASEALGETVRRTRDTLIMFNIPSTGDAVVGALASDLTDAIIDGRGGSRADARTAAIATIASTLVQLETISNELHVNGVDATSSMNASIAQVSPVTPASMVEDLTATAGMLASIRTGLAAAAAVSADPKVGELRMAADGLQAGMDPSIVRTLLPDDYRATLQNVLLAVGGGSDQIVDEVNNWVRDGAPANAPPTISGTPPAQVSVNTSYDFLPSASDPNLGDTLTYSISGRPSWASFSTTTGRLSGTPGDGDVGTFSNITISVSDGEASDSLGPFSITVQGSSVGSVTLSWLAPTENEDGTPLTDLDGYRIYWGTTPGSYPNSVTINNESVTTYVVDNLAPGTYEFVATSFNTSGVESAYSSSVTRTVQ